MNGAPTFAQQRLVCVALLLGMTFYAVVAGIVLSQNEGRGLAHTPIEILETVVVIVGASLAIAAFAVRAALQRAAERADPDERAVRRFHASLVPLALLEGGCLFGITVWLLNGRPVPSLVVAMVLLALAIVVVPFSDPDADVGARNT